MKSQICRNIICSRKRAKRAAQEAKTNQKCIKRFKSEKSTPTKTREIETRMKGINRD